MTWDAHSPGNEDHWKEIRLVMSLMSSIWTLSAHTARVSTFSFNLPGPLSHSSDGGAVRDFRVSGGQREILGKDVQAIAAPAHRCVPRMTLKCWPRPREPQYDQPPDGVFPSCQHDHRQMLFLFCLFVLHKEVVNGQRQYSVPCVILQNHL